MKALFILFALPMDVNPLGESAANTIIKMLELYKATDKFESDASLLQERDDISAEVDFTNFKDTMDAIQSLLYINNDFDNYIFKLDNKKLILGLTPDTQFTWNKFRDPATKNKIREILSKRFNTVRLANFGNPFTSYSLADNGKLSINRHKNYFDYLNDNRIITSNVQGEPITGKLNERYFTAQSVIEIGNFSITPKQLPAGAQISTSEEVSPAKTTVSTTEEKKAPTKPKNKLGLKVPTNRNKPRINEDFSEILLSIENDNINVDVQEVFNENNELSKIGTVSEYSNYLNTVFPNSKSRNILYHGTKNKFDEFSKEKLGSYTNSPSAKLGFFFASNKQNSMHYAASSVGGWKSLNLSFEEIEKAKKKSNELYTTKYLTEVEEYNKLFKELSSLNEEYQKQKLENLWRKITKFFKELLKGNFYNGADSLLPLILSIEQQLESKKINIKNINNEIDTLNNQANNKIYDNDLYILENDAHVKRVLLNIVDPLIEDDLNKGYRSDSYVNRLNKAISNNNDSVIIKNTIDPAITDVYAVFETDQIHILGSTKDIEGFKNYIKNKPSVSSLDKQAEALMKKCSE